MLFSGNQNFLYIQINKRYCNGYATNPQIDNSFKINMLINLLRFYGGRRWEKKCRNLWEIIHKLVNNPVL